MPLLKTGRLIRAGPPPDQQAPDPALRRQVERQVRVQVDAAAQLIAQQAQAAQDKANAERQARILAEYQAMRRLAQGNDAGGRLSKVMAGAGRAIPAPTELYGFGAPTQPSPALTRKKKAKAS